MRDGKYNCFGRFGNHSFDFRAFFFRKPSQHESGHILVIDRRPDSQTQTGEIFGLQMFDNRRQTVMTAVRATGSESQTPKRQIDIVGHNQHLGRLESQTDANTNVTSYRYDTAGRSVGFVDGEQETWGSGYNDAGGLSRSRPARCRAST